MTQMNSRRMVLGSMVAVAGAGSASLLVQTRATAAAQAVEAAGGDADPVLGEIREQWKAALTGIQNGSAEAARSAAALAQVWAARIYARTSDSELRALAQRAVRRQGRAAVLDGPVDHADVETHLRALGLTTADIARLNLHAPADRQAKEAALDRLLAGGLAPLVERAVQLLTLTADQLDARGGASPVAARQNWCGDICLAPDLFKLEMEIACALAALGAIFPPMLVFAEICALFASFWLSALAMCWLCRFVWGG